MGMENVAADQIPHGTAHNTPRPYIGVQNVTWMLDGEIAHKARHCYGSPAGTASS
jgi:redox-sensitive bicupin YhaK (pirin superfamily)